MGTPLVAYVHRGGHGFPLDATDALVAFLRDQVKSESPTHARR